MHDGVLVTGGAGFIGSHLVEALLEEGRDVIAFDNFDDFYDPGIKRTNIATALKSPRFTLVKGDIRDAQQLDECLTTFRPTLIVHLAARAGVRPSVAQPALYQEVNCTGTINLLEAARKYGIGQVVFGSSSSVYGANSSVPFREDARADGPISPYAATKRAGELLCHTFHHLYGIKITCLRFFTVYGPRQRPDLAIHKFARLITEGQEVPVYGDGSAQRDFTYIDDILQGVMRAIETPFDFDIFNLGESRTISVTQLVNLLEESLGMKADVAFYPPQPGDVPITYADISKARDSLGYNPTTPIEEGIVRFVEWYRTTRGNLAE